MAIKPGPSSWLDEEDNDGSGNSPFRVENCGKDSCSLGSGYRGRIKKNENDTRMNLVQR